MAPAIAVRSDYSSGEVRGFARRARNAAQARRLLAIAAMLEEALREVIVGGMLLSPICSLLVIPTLARLVMPPIGETDAGRRAHAAEH